MSDEEAIEMLARMGELMGFARKSSKTEPLPGTFLEWKLVLVRGNDSLSIGPSLGDEEGWWSFQLGENGKYSSVHGPIEEWIPALARWLASRLDPIEYIVFMESFGTSLRESPP